MLSFELFSLVNIFCTRVRARKKFRLVPPFDRAIVRIQSVRRPDGIVNGWQNDEERP